MSVLGWILLILLAIIVFILVVPLGAHVAYIDSNLKIDAHVAGLNINIVPGKKREKDSEKRPKKEEKKSKKGGKKEARKTSEGGADEEKKTKEKKGLFDGFSVDDFLELAKLLFRTLDRFRRKFTVNKLMLHLVVANEDPYNAAMLYGYVNAGAGILEGLSKRGWRISKRDIQTAVDFESTEMRADAEITITISLARILAVALYALFGFLKIRRAVKKRMKAANKERTDNDGTDANPDVGIPAGEHV